MFLRRPSIDYISCPVCDFDFSSSGGPVIVLDALGRLLSPSGFVLGGRGRFTLSWNHYPGAICYTVYKAVDSNNPNGEYVVVAECIDGPNIDLEPHGPGCYRVSAITENGETELSDPICGVGACPFIISGATPSSQTVDQGDSFMISAVVGNPESATSYLWYKDGILFENTTATTQEELIIASAAETHGGNYTLIVSNAECEDESSPAQVTVNAGPPCTHQIEIVDFLTIGDLASDGTVVGTGAAGSRPWYHQASVSKDIRTSVNSAPTTASQTLTTITASAPIFSVTDEGKYIVFSTSQVARIVTFISDIQVTVTPSQSVASTTFEIRGNTLGGPLGQGLLANANGILAGIEEAFSDPGGFQHTFWFDLNTNEIRDLGTAVANTTRAPADLAEDGFLVIREIDTATPQTNSLLYDSAAQSFTDLGKLGTGSSAEPFALNEFHVVAGRSNLTNGGGIFHATRWAAGVLTDIHPGAAGVGQSSMGLGINESGVIFGTYSDAVVSNKTFVNSGGASLDIGGFGGEVVGIAINDSGTIVGNAETGLGTGVFRAFSWTAGGGIQFLPQLPATTSGSVIGINSAGWIVGENDGTPVIYRDGVTPEELFTLIPGGTLWSAFFTVDLSNDNGWISGIGLYDGGAERYLLQLCS